MSIDDEHDGAGTFTMTEPLLRKYLTATSALVHSPSLFSVFSLIEIKT